MNANTINTKQKAEKGLSDLELIAKYESGKIDMKKAINHMLRSKKS